MSQTSKGVGRARGGYARADKLTVEQRSGIARNAASARWSKPQGASIMPSKSNKLRTNKALEGATPAQRKLDLEVEKQIEVDGVGMGVLSDGTPFLTGRGLARLCGITHAQIQRLSTDWTQGESEKARVSSIKQTLFQRGITLEVPYVAIEQRSGTFFAYPDTICLAVLEYYAFDAGENIKEQAKKNFRLLAGKALRDFIYTQVGYAPNGGVTDVWRQFHDRVSLTYNSVPNGFFGVFKEMADMIVTLGQAGLQIDSTFVPDISVGLCWSKHWTASDLGSLYGERIKFEHNYPQYFPQSASNPQEPWCYPEAALGEFRRWMRDDYIGEGRFSTYLLQKVRQKQLPASFAQLAIAAYTGADA